MACFQVIYCLRKKYLLTASCVSWGNGSNASGALNKMKLSNFMGIKGLSGDLDSAPTGPNLVKENLMY